ncbi:DUF1214 domain-containing protein [Kitasatospora sp. NPDC018058]|uniref:DUF1214 domain-containing protein n=1 Tax=Kitasatospora sp. NPDC018058 TaxID=3364025 RepID=UPI0037C04CAE
MGRRGLPSARQLPRRRWSPSAGTQAEPPAEPDLQTANWLPIPTSGKFTVTLRLYAPQTDEIPADWPPALTPAEEPA